MVSRVLAGIDVPSTTTSGSIALARDLYAPAGHAHAAISSYFVTLGPPRNPAQQAWWRTLALQKEAVGYHAALASEMKKLLDAWQPQVFHLHHLTYGMTSALLEVNRDHGLPMIAICHGTDLLDARTDSAHRAAVVRTLSHATVTLFPTAAMASEAAVLSPGTAHKFRVLPWGIPRVPLVPPRDPESADALYAGRLDKNKDVETIIAALEDSRFSGGLTIIGSGPEGRRLELLAAELGVAERVTFVPFLERARLWEAFSRFWTLIISSRQLEGFGLIAVEAQAAGLPVIYAATPGLAEVLGGSALAFEPGSPKALAAAVSRLRSDPCLRLALREAGLANSVRFDLCTFRRSVEGLSARLAAGGQPG